MFDVLKRHQIQVLREAGHAQSNVARLSGVSEQAVRRIEREPPVANLAEPVDLGGRPIGRPSKVEPYQKFIDDLLRSEPDLMSLEVLRRARLVGYAGGKTALYELIAAHRPPKTVFTMRFEGLPGEFSQHDFGQVDVRFMDESRLRVHFFALRLKYSRWAQVTLVPDERVESLVRPLVEHFQAWGGVPLMAVFDRPKTVALKWGRDGVVTEWNTTFAYVTLDLGVGVELCWPHSPQQKGSDENLVGWVKGSFFKQRRFLDDADMEQQLAEWHEETNTRRPSRATGVPPAERMAEERKRLRPLKVAPENLALRIPIYVGPTATVLHDTHIYSMPPDAAGFAGTLYLHRDRVRIVAGKFDVAHPRLFEKGAKSTLPEHLATHVAAMAGKRGKRYLMRQHLLDVGQEALEYLTEITHRRPRAWASEVEQLHEFLQRHGPEALRRAFGQAIAAGVFGVEYVSRYLRHPKCASVPPRPFEQETLPL